MLLDTRTAWLVCLELLLAVTCLYGDHVTFSPWLKRLVPADRWYPLARALCDSATHAAIGMWSWALVRYHSVCDVIPEIALCGFLSSAVDLDHFIAAKSLHLKDALSLPGRAPFHNSCLIPFLTLAFLGMGQLFSSPAAPMSPDGMAGWPPPVASPAPPAPPLSSMLPWIFCTAWSSHHIRDATRRGLWLAPFGSTPPLPYWGYVLLTLLFPLLMRFLLIYFNAIALSVTVASASRRLVQTA